MNTKILTVLLVVAILPLFSMELDIPEKRSEEKEQEPKVAFSLSGVINKFNTPVTLIKLKETNPFQEEAATINPQFVYNIPSHMIQNQAIILAGTGEKHDLIEPFFLHYPKEKYCYLSLVIVAANLITIRTDTRAELEKKLSLTEIDSKGGTSVTDSIPFNNGDNFILKVTQDGKIKLQKSESSLINRLTQYSTKQEEVPLPMPAANEFAGDLGIDDRFVNSLLEQSIIPTNSEPEGIQALLNSLFDKDK